MKIYLPDFHIVEKRKASAEAIIVRFLDAVYILLLTTGLQFILHKQNNMRFNSVERYFLFENRK